MRLKVLSGLLILLICACESEEPVKEVISFEELAGETGEEAAPGSAPVVSAYPRSAQFTRFIENQLGQFDTILQRKVHALDRFNFTTSYKLDFHVKRSTDPSATPSPDALASVYYYAFGDSVKTKNAFYNWLDCFGKSCESVKLNQNLDKVDSDGIFAVVYDTVIVAVEYPCENVKYNWKEFESGLLKEFGESYKYQISTRCGGPLEWK